MNFRNNQIITTWSRLDFERLDDDELGFHKNDVVTIISQKDEHCWIGELNGLRGSYQSVNHVASERIMTNNNVSINYYRSFRRLVSRKIRRTIGRTQQTIFAGRR